MKICKIKKEREKKQVRREGRGESSRLSPRKWPDRSSVASNSSTRSSHENASVTSARLFTFFFATPPFFLFSSLFLPLPHVIITNARRATFRSDAMRVPMFMKKGRLCCNYYCSRPKKVFNIFFWIG